MQQITQEKHSIQKGFRNEAPGSILASSWVATYVAPGDLRGPLGCQVGGRVARARGPGRRTRPCGAVDAEVGMAVAAQGGVRGSPRTVRYYGWRKLNELFHTARFIPWRRADHRVFILESKSAHHTGAG